MSLPSALPLPLSADEPAPRPRARWEFWRSPADQPRWARPVLLGIAALAALMYARNIAQAGLAPFYSVAVKSMSVSWKAFFYGAFDPGATITIDAWVQSSCHTVQVPGADSTGTLYQCGAR